ncbi:YbaK/EbsC family protein [Qingshengfaniella alkalisoli]|uniref:YbaK/EbsC family protein n=1 Tax=Qingshengfaniella alkalisoli TaxID=2599296 RepID=A0A5B8I741_9RHOB|nr:YbaK/EbsC family protein [Qingshengfaniella alkalisoli]QDY69369.1 YbaK/EbsC family protein [Qingshengfaniella alkalisoli]
MSKSLKRVRAALTDGAVPIEILQMNTLTRTAIQAAEAVGCEIDQIAKSIIFRGEQTGQIVLFITAGANQVCPDRASDVAGQALGKADADFVRKTTGFAIGGVSPVGHLSPPVAYFDPRLRDFETVWAAAGTPNHVFAITPENLILLSGAVEADFVVP